MTLLRDRIFFKRLSVCLKRVEIVELFAVDDSFTVVGDVIVSDDKSASVADLLMEAFFCAKAPLPSLKSVRFRQKHIFSNNMRAEHSVFRKKIYSSQLRHSQRLLLSPKKSDP